MAGPVFSPNYISPDAKNIFHFRKERSEAEIANLFIWYTCLGLAGFCLLLLYDAATLRQTKNRVFLAVAGYVVHASALVISACGGYRFSIPGAGMAAGWLAVAAGVGWMLYCLFLYPPIMRTYLTAQGPSLVTSGPYALCRHPGVYGYTAAIIGLIIVCRSYLLLLCGPVWILANIVYVFIQDRWLFPRMFSGYDRYSLATPMLLPNGKSLKYVWCNILQYVRREKHGKFNESASGR